MACCGLPRPSWSSRCCPCCDHLPWSFLMAGPLSWSFEAIYIFWVLSWCAWWGNLQPFTWRVHWQFVLLQRSTSWDCTFVRDIREEILPVFICRLLSVTNSCIPIKPGSRQWLDRVCTWSPLGFYLCFVVLFLSSHWMHFYQPTLWRPIGMHLSSCLLNHDKLAAKRVFGCHLHLRSHKIMRISI